MSFRFSVIVSLFLLAVSVSGLPTDDFKKTTNCGQGRSAANPKCCVWYDVLEDLQERLFDNECEEEAHQALRLTFHDAIGFSPQIQRTGAFGGGGADGSIMEHADIETAFGANNGISDIIELERRIALKHSVSFADFIQFAGAAAVTNCAGGPRIPFLAGRANTSLPSPDKLVPSPADNVTKILARMQDAGFSAQETVHLLASHSIGDQVDLDPSIAGAPFDSTPSTFDSNFYLEVLLTGDHVQGNGTGFASLPSGIKGEFRMESDSAIARDPRTACEWQSLITIEQNQLQEKFSAAMLKLSLLGQKPELLHDCSDVIPRAKAAPRKAVSLPAGKTRADIQASCKQVPFPHLPTDRGAEKSVPPVPQGSKSKFTK